MRIGQGFDVHALKAGEGLPLGGVWMPCDYAVIAHSDGDVLLHALTDAILGALGEGDIGQWFPDNDPRFAGADSKVLLTEVWERAVERGFELGNADLTVIGQVPKVGPAREAIQASVATLLGAEHAQVNIKATTTEKLGFTGRKEGIAAQAAVLLVKRP